MPHLQFVFLCSVALFAGWNSLSMAGLVIEIDPEIDGSRVDDLAILNGNLIVGHDGQKTLIELPEGVLKRVAQWAAADAAGPTVVSMDRAIAGLPGNVDGYYFPPCVPADIGNALLDYDVYANALGVGWVPDSRMRHPLIRDGKASLMPNQHALSLLDPDNDSAQAAAFQNLASRYRFPGLPFEPQNVYAVGALTVRARANADGFPVVVEASSHRWMMLHSWYRAQEAPGEADRRAAALPFAPLRRDMEERWEAYRGAFAPMDELSRIVEAYAILDAVHRNNEELWVLFRDRLGQGVLPVPEPENVRFNASQPSLLTSSGNYAERWLQYTRDGVGEEVETVAEANTALRLIRSGDAPPDSKEDWLEAIGRFAVEDSRLNAKLALHNALDSVGDPLNSKFSKHCRKFLRITTKGKHELFRLRAFGLHRLTYRAGRRLTTLTQMIAQAERELDIVRAQLELRQSSLGDSNIVLKARLKVSPSLRREAQATREAVVELNGSRTACIEDFIQRVNEHAAVADRDNEIDVFVWESLSQDVYSTGLLQLASFEFDGQLPTKLLRALAFVHYFRGKAEQVGLELAYRHSHFRYLGYLSQLVKDQELREQIERYRAELASMMGLRGWEEESRR